MKKVHIICLIFVIAIATAAGADDVQFKEIGTPEGSDSLLLTGKLIKPDGDKPCPALVLLHGCAGMSKYFDLWAERLKNWGYVTLQVDSLKPRGLTSICKDPSLLPPGTRAQDAYAAKTYLSTLSFVDPNRIGLIGWSHGGWTVLGELTKNREKPFRSAIAFYPYCNIDLINLNAPLLILIGELDDWCPAYFCSAKMPSEKSGHEISLKIYPGAYHCFDCDGIDMTVDYHRLLYNQAAASDAIVQVKVFLGKHLK